MPMAARSLKSCESVRRENVNVEDMKKFIGKDFNDHCGYSFCGGLFGCVFDDGNGYGDGSGHNDN